MTGIMAFAGIGLSPDATGEFLFSLFAVIAISLLLSWALASTVTPLLGMPPLLTDAFFKSMAATIMGGLAFASILTLIAAPEFYHVMFGGTAAERAGHAPRAA